MILNDENQDQHSEGLPTKNSTVAATLLVRIIFGHITSGTNEYHLFIVLELCVRRVFYSLWNLFRFVHSIIRRLRALCLTPPVWPQRSAKGL